MFVFGLFLYSCVMMFVLFSTHPFIRIMQHGSHGGCGIRVLL